MTSDRRTPDPWASPNAKVQRVPLAAARWTDGFWADRFQLCRDVVIPYYAWLNRGPTDMRVWLALA